MSLHEWMDVGSGLVICCLVTAVVVCSGCRPKADDQAHAAAAARPAPVAVPSTASPGPSGQAPHGRDPRARAHRLYTRGDGPALDKSLK
jgi:hypothetical protein